MNACAIAVWHSVKGDDAVENATRFDPALHDVGQQLLDVGAHRRGAARDGDVPEEGLLSARDSLVVRDADASDRSAGNERAPGFEGHGPSLNVPAVASLSRYPRSPSQCSSSIRATRSSRRVAASPVSSPARPRPASCSRFRRGCLPRPQDRRWRYDHAGSGRRIAAICRDRRSRLAKITAPTLVVHRAVGWRGPCARSRSAACRDGAC